MDGNGKEDFGAGFRFGPKTQMEKPIMIEPLGLNPIPSIWCQQLCKRWTNIPKNKKEKKN